jgi:DNA-binding NtrC family response regulator
MRTSGNAAENAVHSKPFSVVGHPSSSSSSSVDMQPVSSECHHPVLVLLFERQSSSLGLRECLSGLADDRVHVRRLPVEEFGKASVTAACLADSSPRPVAVLTMDSRDPASAALMRHLRAEAPHVPVLAVSMTSDPEDICCWLTLGAADYVTPPFTRTSVLPRLLRLAFDGPRNEAAGDDELQVEGLVGRSTPFRALVEQIRNYARCDATVLIEGETGTGKELCARAIHRLSARRARPFCAINCGAIPRDLVENELFGHRQAAFTGASGSQAGLIAESEGGTVLFDEVDCFASGSQATLLRFVQNQEYRPLGATRVSKADVRILAATNASLATKSREGAFREDLYYRLDMLRVRVPPLRERREDIPLLATRALRIFATRFQSRGRGFSESALERLVAYDWPGNVRELEHAIGRAVARAFDEQVIQAHHLEIGGGEGVAVKPALSFREGKRHVVEEFERSRVCAYLAAHGGNIGRAARAARKNRRAFWELMRKYSIRAEEFQPPPKPTRTGA